MVNFDSDRGNFTNPMIHDGKTRSLELYLSQHYAKNNEAKELLSKAVDAIKTYKPAE